MSHIRIIIAISLLVAPLQAQPGNQPDVGAVIAALPARRVLVEYVRQWRTRREHVPGDSTTKVPHLKSDAEIEATLKTAETSIQQLRKSIRTGASVFIYPGLLASGDIRFNASPTPSYSLHIGIPPGWNWDHEQGPSPSEFIIRFDQSGTITSVDPVTIRH
jgi:hypothetical protein